MKIDAENFVSDYHKSWIVQRLLSKLYQDCYRYEIKTNGKKPNFDQYGFIKSENRYITVDELNLLYSMNVESVVGYIEKIETTVESMLHPDVMDAKLIHVHMAYRGYLSTVEYENNNEPDIDKLLENRREVYLETLYTKYDKIQGVNCIKPDEEKEAYQQIEFPKTYHRKWVSDDYLIMRAEETLKAYGETDLISSSLKKKIVFFTGSGISKESGIPTFRDDDGLWEQYPVQQIAYLSGWYSDPTFVNEFYNELRTKYANMDENGEYGILPNQAHKEIVRLASVKKDFVNDESQLLDINTFTGTDNEVVIITQNIDDLHERALIEIDSELIVNDDNEVVTNGNEDNIDSSNCDCKCGCNDEPLDLEMTDSDRKEDYTPKHNVRIIHLHGELNTMCIDGKYKEDKNYHVKFPYKGRLTIPPDTVAGQIFTDLTVVPDDVTKIDMSKSRMRPYIVFFGENVPNMSKAIHEILTCDVFVIIGTSLQVYPAANLIKKVPYGVPIIYIDPNPNLDMDTYWNIKEIQKGASKGMVELLNNWNNYVKG